MIHAHLHPADEAWINEGDSVLAQVLNATPTMDTPSKGQRCRLATRCLERQQPVSLLRRRLSVDAVSLRTLWRRSLPQDRACDSSLSNMAVFDDVLAKLGYAQRADDVSPIGW